MNKEERELLIDLLYMEHGRMTFELPIGTPDTIMVVNLINKLEDGEF